jgi:DNA-binding sugar fermentation-stimulating protein
MFSRKHNLKDIMSKGNETPVAIINNVDFEMIAHRLHFDPYYEEMFKTMPEEQINHIMRTSNNVIDTMEMILKVVKDESNS